MLNDMILEKIFGNKDMQMIPIGYQSISVNVFDRVLESIKEENPDVKLSELLSTDEYE